MKLYSFGSYAEELEESEWLLQVKRKRESDFLRNCFAKAGYEDILSGNVDEFQTSVLQMGSCLAIRSSANYSWVCYDTHSGCLYLNPYKSASQTSMPKRNDKLDCSSKWPANLLL